MVGQENSSLPKEEYDSTPSTLPPSPTLFVSPKPIKTSPRSKRARDLEHDAPDNPIRKQLHVVNTGSADSKTRSSTAKPQESIIVIDLVSDEQDSESPVKNEALAPAASAREKLPRTPSHSPLKGLQQSLSQETIEHRRKFTLAEPTVSSREPAHPWRQSPFKPEQSPEIIPFSQISLSFDISHGISPEYSLGSDSTFAFDSERSLFGSSSTGISQPSPPSSKPCSSFAQPPQSSQPRQQGKLKSITNDWARRFIERQRNPPRRAARRRPLKAKKPLTIPRLSRGKRFESNSTRDLSSACGGVAALDQISNPYHDESGTRDLSADRNEAVSSLPNISESSFNCGAKSAGQKQKPVGLSGRKARIEKPTFLKPHSDIINIALGPTTFLVYADFISWHCPLLARECQPSHGRPVLPKSLEDVDVDVFGLFINWLYTERLVNKRGDPPFQQRSIGLYVLANRLQMLRLTNEAIDALEARRRKEGDIQTKAFHYIYENTKDGDLLRQYITDVCFLFPPQLSEDIKRERFPDELVQDIFVASLASQIKAEEGEIDTSRYHMKVEP